MKRIIIFCVITLYGCAQQHKITDNQYNVRKTDKQFFSKNSFWNTPIPQDAPTDPNSSHYIGLLNKEPNAARFAINLDKWTIPVYEVNDTTPLYNIQLHHLTPEEKKGWKTTRDHFGHGAAFRKTQVPIPFDATPDPMSDSHLALVDYEKRVAWDMWGLKKREDGNWESKTGMKYSLDGDGTFVNEKFNVQDGESIHFHGPSRAPGVPAIAGLIMYDEVIRGEINHKLAACTRFAALQEFTYPAIWADGFLQGGIPEGATLQLDPKLDLAKFGLLPGEIAVARAAQKYGIVIVDWGGGQALYAEGLWGHKGKSWNGLLRFVDGFSKIPYNHFRVIKMDKVIRRGDAKNKGKDPLTMK